MAEPAQHGAIAAEQHEHQSALDAGISAAATASSATGTASATGAAQRARHAERGRRGAGALAIEVLGDAGGENITTRTSLAASSAPFTRPALAFRHFRAKDIVS